jgi:hypothetical protein
MMEGLPILVLARVFLIVFAFGLLVVVPAARIYPRVGFSSWFGLIALPPAANFVLLWFVAFALWPAYADREHRA